MQAKGTISDKKARPEKVVNSQMAVTIDDFYVDMSIGEFQEIYACSDFRINEKPQTPSRDINGSKLIGSASLHMNEAARKSDILGAKPCIEPLLSRSQ